MLKFELLELIENGENSEVEFKLDSIRPEQLAREAVAFANAQGGYILLGVADDGEIIGIQRNDLEEWIMDTVFGRYVHPFIVPTYKEIKIDEQRRVAVVKVDSGVAKPYVVRHGDRQDIYIRLGSVSRRAEREQVVRLYQQGGMLHSEQLPVSGSTLEALDSNRLESYLSSIMGDNTLPDSDTAWCSRLCDLDIMLERESGPVCTIAGLVLFGRSPRQFLRQAGVRWMAFEGKEKSGGALDDRRIDGPLVPSGELSAGGRFGINEDGLLGSVIEAMRPFVRKESDEVGISMRRDRTWLYPVEALREAIVNAIVHRDWTRNEEIEVVQYADRLEVLSPGALQNSMTVEKMLAGRRSPRNPLIAEVLQHCGYVDARGMGVRNKIVPLLREHSGTEPEFEATEDHLRVVMHRGQEPPSTQE